jgi:hypothetical protein
MRRAWPLLCCAACVSAEPELVPSMERAAPVQRQRSELVLRCTPPDAEVLLDGVPQGLCGDYGGQPKGLGLGSGTRRVVVRKSGYQSWDSLMVADGTRMTVDITLNSNGGSTP